MNVAKTFYYKNNRFQQLRGFYFAAKLGSVTKAAQLMCLTQPSISLQIKALEGDLRCKLFERNGPNITLTEEGQILLKLVKPIVEGIDSLKENFAIQIDKASNQQLNIAANQATMLYLLPKLVHKFSSTFPYAKIKMYGAVEGDGIKKLRTGKVDLIVGPANFDIPQDYVYKPMFRYDPVLITRPEHPLAGKDDVTFEDMCKYQLILPPESLHTIKNLEETLLQYDFDKTNVRLEFEGWEIIKKYVELDMAITIALSIAIEDDPVLVGTKLNHYFAPSTYGIITKRGQIFPKKVQDFIDSIQ